MLNTETETRSTPKTMFRHVVGSFVEVVRRMCLVTPVHLVTLGLAVGAPAHAQYVSDDSGVRLGISGTDSESASKGYTIFQAWHDAVRVDQDIAAAQSDVWAAVHGVEAAESQFGLSFSATSSFGYEEDTAANDSIFSSDTSRYGYQGSIGLALSQPLLTFGRKDASLKSSSASIIEAMSIRDQVVETVLLSVSGAYLRTLTGLAQLKILEEELATVREQADAIQKRRNERKSSITELRQIQSRLKQLEARYLQIVLNVDTARAELVDLTGTSRADDLSLDDVINRSKRVTLNEEEVVRQHLAMSSAMRRARAVVQVAEANLELNDAQDRPQVNLTAGINQRFSTRRVGSVDYRLNFEASGSVYDSGLAAAQLAQLTRASVGSSQRLKTVAMRVELEARNLIKAAKSAARVSKVWADSLELEREAAENLRDAFERGDVHIAEVLDAERSALQAALGREQAVHDHYAALLRVDALINNPARKYTNDLDLEWRKRIMDIKFETDLN